jgi:glutamate racemase
VVGERVTLISSAEETAKDVYRRLAKLGLMRDESLAAPVHEFRTTGDPEQFKEIGRRFLGPELSHVSTAATLDS